MTMPPENPAKVTVLPEDDKQAIEALKRALKEMAEKVQFLVDLLDNKGLLEEHAFEFPDGDIWKSKDVEPV